MPSPSPAACSPEPPTVLVAGLSARALAAAAKRAGFRPLAADLFGDQDTRRLAWRSRRVAGSVERGLEPAALMACLDSLSHGLARPPIGLVAGGGLGDQPDLLAALAERMALIGNGPAQVRAVKDPRNFFTLLDRLSIPHPTVSLAEPSNRRGWLVKKTAASGGAHIKAARLDQSRETGSYFQRRVRGRPISVLFLADGKGALVLGFSEQWASPAGPRTPFRFGGLVQPAELTTALAADLGAVIDQLVPQTGLVGLNSADFMVRQRDFDLLEINPRIGASLDIFDRSPNRHLFALHAQATAGKLPTTWRMPNGSRASAVIYADRRLTIPSGFTWPRWSADRPDQGTVVERGAPLCTVFAGAVRNSAARSLTLSRSREILASLRRPKQPSAQANRAEANPT